MHKRVRKQRKQRTEPSAGSKAEAIVAYWDSGYRAVALIAAAYSRDHEGAALPMQTVHSALNRWREGWRAELVTARD